MCIKKQNNIIKVISRNDFEEFLSKEFKPKPLSSEETKKRRYFSTEEREALFIIAGGRCQICGCLLENNDFECDHIIPFSQGGPTDIINGQAVCLKCNRSKGDRQDG